ncbi:MAG TPA: riboflavin synthase [Acidimicrobiia bacterium]|jgi:riboflavin synthase|nr:riboflavin synthase [Acidimicrobiia bacterium]
MFTGIVEHLGKVASIDTTERGRAITIDAGPITDGMAVGASVAVNGVCLTAVSIDGETLVTEVMGETLDRTSLGDLAAGDSINLERPMAANGRFDGHIVQGHVDGVGRVRSLEPDGTARRMWIDVPASLMRYVVEKGSITVDGVSLTVAGVDEAGLEVALIPHTLEVTTLGERQPGDTVNLEVDVIAKYVERMLGASL